MSTPRASLDFFHRPSSVAVVGASDDTEKIGGRPLRYMREFGFAGRVVPVNPRRDTVQGLPAVPSLQDSPVVPDVALIAVPGAAAVEAVATAADMGVPGCVVMSSGFAETGTAEGERLQAELLGHARRSGMRIVGPNSQGLATFSSGAVLGFSTLFTEEPPEDGPVGIVSQSGALASVPYGILRRRGIGVRYVHGTGNDADVSAAELAAAAIDDPELKLLLLYLENVADPESLIALGEKSRRNDTPVVALVGGRSAGGSRAAASHTGALATERRVLDAFFERVGIWQVHSVRELVAASELYLRDWRPRGNRLAVVSNSGAVCVLAADAAEDEGLPLAELAPDTVEGLKRELPAFAATGNPVDVTAALLTDSTIFGRVLPILGADPNVDACLLAIPVAGRGYDVEQFASDAAAFAASGTPLVLAVPQPNVAEPFVRTGLPVFEEESGAVAALGQYLAHRRRMARADGLPRPAVGPREPLHPRQLNEADSLAALAELGVPVVAHEFVPDPAQVAGAFTRLGVPSVVVKGSTSETGHKSELGLVQLRRSSPAEARAAAEEIAASAERHGVALDGFLVAPMVAGLHEVLIGASLDPVFGPVMVVGAGGVYVEAMSDTRVLLAPCTPEEVHEAIAQLRMAPVLAGLRGQPAADVDAWVKAVVRASEVLADAASPIAGFDANPVMLLRHGAAAVDAVVLRR
ncbi:acetate--CoA ligase family protein [Blastococcus sp. PRF04-17]|uniref:acetate--CoA ligase family protein n=1 Tax=Blastococcus sp. PRF04-17 TaxID=2933797 RepID=UPI001FF45BA8|nr:acetate--CoA ligase family protein [Blastococcus sp. PRF04-17]UOY02612.1 acetate--CoA ligase family protein [Blastococcus sp. PRF04-17]